MTLRRTTSAVLTGPLLAAALLTGCSADDAQTSDSGGSSARGGTDTDTVVPGSAPSAPARDAAGGRDDRTSGRVLPADRDVVYRGSVTVRVDDVARAADRAEALVLDVDGVVFAEQTTAGAHGRRGAQATMTLRVPPARFGATLDALAALGRELDRTRSAQDITTELTDTDSRVRSQERSVDRMRVLLGRADTIGQVVQVESELARREADLESLQAQLARLRDVTALATIDVTFVARDDASDPRAEGDDELGFLSGLRGGWAAFVEVVLVALTVLGALLPFAVAATLVGYPAYLLMRRQRRARAARLGPA